MHLNSFAGWLRLGLIVHNIRHPLTRGIRHTLYPLRELRGDIIFSKYFSNNQIFVEGAPQTSLQQYWPLRSVSFAPRIAPDLLNLFYFANIAILTQGRLTPKALHAGGTFGVKTITSSRRPELKICALVTKYGMK